MKNERGSVMIITLGFVLIFTLLGMASIYYAGTQNLMAEELKSSSEAFWLADGAVEQAEATLPIMPVTGTIYLLDEDGNPNLDRYYILAVDTMAGGFEWEIEATGSVSDQGRRIFAIASFFDLGDGDNSEPVITCNEINPFPTNVLDGQDDIKLLDECSDIQKFFPLSIDEVCDPNDSNVSVINSDNPSEVFSNITCRNFLPGDDQNAVIAFAPSITDYNVLVVDVTQLNISDPNKVPKVFIAGEVKGLVIIKGNAQLLNIDLDGVLILDGEVEIVNTANSSIEFDKEDLDGALSLLDFSSLSGGSSAVKIVSWEEVFTFSGS